MNIFGKYDIQKDGLRIEFDLDTNLYSTYLKDQKIPFNKLNKKSSNEIIMLNNRLSDQGLLNVEIERARKKREVDDRSNLLKSLGFVVENRKFSKLVSNQYYIDFELERKLDEMFSDKNKYYGLYKLKYIDKEKLANILENGINLNSQMEDEVSFFGDNTAIKDAMLYADRNVSGSILIMIDKEELETVASNKDVYGNINVEGKYLVGFFPLSKNGNLISMESVETLKNNA